MSTSTRFYDRVVLITGVNSGISAATAAVFMSSGARVLIVNLEEPTFQKSDVSSPEDCATAVATCVKTYGKIDVLYHNAGLLCPPDHMPDMDVAAIQKVLLTKFDGLFYLAKAAIPHMRAQGRGSIISTASTSGLSGAMNLAPYAASKAGIINLTKTVALTTRELSRSWNDGNANDGTVCADAGVERRSGN